MEQIYTVRVKCRPNPELNYPSERAYSSSTVGGLAFAHLLLALLALTLCTIRYSAQLWRGEYVGGILLVGGALTAGAAGLLACKRWYVDRHIRWFLLAALASSACAFASSLLAALLLLRPVGFDPGDDLKHDITVHILLASVAELVWSLLSVGIAWRGVRNSYGGRPKRSDKRPDILRSVEPNVSNYADVVKELCRLQKTSGLALGETGTKIVSGFCQNDDGLPLPESHQEYRERIEKFLQSNCEQCDSGIS